MHGTGDTSVPYDGGEVDGRKLPGAADIAATWAARNGCSPTADTSAPPIDLDLAQTGSETTISRFAECLRPGAVELWTMSGTGHIPNDLARDFPRRISSFFESHVRP